MKLFKSNQEDNYRELYLEAIEKEREHVAYEHKLSMRIIDLEGENEILKNRIESLEDMLRISELCSKIHHDRKMDYLSLWSDAIKTKNTDSDEQA